MPSATGTGGGGTTISSIADVPGLADALNAKMATVDYVDAGKILVEKQHESAAASIAFLPKNLAASMEANYSTPSIFNGFYQLDGTVAPFSGSAGVAYSESVELSPLGQPYSILNCTDAINSFGLHLANTSSTFNPLAGKSYTAYWVVRGTGNSVGKKITVGWYQASRVQAQVTLGASWTLAQVTAVHTKSEFNCYVHLTGQGANLVVNDEAHVAALYIQQND